MRKKNILRDRTIGSKRIDKLESTIREFMSKWGEVQEKRDRRDEIWDEMVRVVSIQNKNKGK